MGWEHTVGAPGHEGSEQQLQHFLETNTFLPIFQPRPMFKPCLENKYWQ